MDFLKMFCGAMIFVFAVMFFPTLYNTILAETPTFSGGATVFIEVFPYIYILAALLPSAYLVMRSLD